MERLGRQPWQDVPGEEDVPQLHDYDDEEELDQQFGGGQVVVGGRKTSERLHYLMLEQMDDQNFVCSTRSKPSESHARLLDTTKCGVSDIICTTHSSPKPLLFCFQLQSQSHVRDILVASG